LRVTCDAIEPAEAFVLKARPPSGALIKMREQRQGDGDMFARIVLGIDGSDHADKAADVAMVP
jgi:hypothetical protein